MLAGDFADFSERLDYSKLVIHRHDAYQQGRGLNGRLQLREVDQSVRLHRQVGDFKPLHFHVPRRIEHAFMLGLHGDDMVFLFLVKRTDGFQRNVVGFRRAAGENNFFRIGINQPRYLLARYFARGLRLPTERMAARVRITKLLGKVRQHRLHHPRIAGRGRLIIQENRHRGCFFMLDF